MQKALQENKSFLADRVKESAEWQFSPVDHRINCE